MSSDKINGGVPFRRPYRFVMAVLLLLCPFCTMVPYVTPSVFMEDIMGSFGCDLGMAGFSMTIQLGATGVCMFIGTFIQDRLGIRKSIVISIWGMVVGNVMAFLSGSIWMFLAARFISGFGQGLYMVSMTPCISTWFEGKERTYMITFNAATNSVALAISYAVNRPLANLLGGWQRVLLLYAAVIAVVAVVWMLFGKSSPEETAKDVSAGDDAAQGRQRSSLVRACKEIQYWKLFVFMALLMMTNTTIASYLPTYLTTERGLDPTIATSISSLNSLIGIVGSLIGGTLCAQLRRRKPILISVAVLYMIVGICLTIFTNGGVVLVLALLAGILYNMPLTAQSNVMIETKQPFDPTILGGAVSITSGLGQLMCVFVSFIFSAITGVAGMTTAYRMFFASMLVAAAAAAFLKETGTREG